MEPGATTAEWNPGATTAEWNLGAKGINALEFKKNGQILFTLFEEGFSGEEFECLTGGLFFHISPFTIGDAVCLSAVNRMASMLLAAKLSGKRVHVHRNACEVTHVALKP